MQTALLRCDCAACGGSFLKPNGSLKHQVGRIGGDASGLIAGHFQHDAGALRRASDSQRVMQGESLHHRADFVVAVRAARADIQSQVDFCVSVSGNRSH